MPDPVWMDWIGPFIDWAQMHPAIAAHVAAGIPLLVLLVHELLRRPQPPPLDHTPERIAPGAAAPAAVAEVHAPAEAPEAVAPAPPLEAAPPAPEPAPPAAEPIPPAPPPAPPGLEPAAPVVEPAPTVVTPVPEAPPPPKPRPLRERLARTRENVVGRMSGLLAGRKVDEELLDELEALLFTADLGVRTAESLLERVRKEARGAPGERVRELLRDAVAEKLRRVEPREGEFLATTAKPHVILVLGVNGSGKTTTIGKLAARYREAGRRVVLGAGDTFRAAAIEQLQSWGARVGCEVVAGSAGGDPAAVAYDTVKTASSQHADVAIVDTAGRLQTKAPLMQELGKIVRVIGRELEGAPHEILLVLDANTGQNAISQAREFTAAAGVTGLVLTKLDGTAKGGVVVGLADEFGIPVKYMGVGEGVEDLRDFSADEFVAALFAR